MHPLSRPWALIAGLAVTAMAGGCNDATTPAAGTDDANGPHPVVIATTSILGDIVQNVAGDCATVEVLLAPGVDPHEAELSARQAARLREADVVFAFGLGLEEHLHDALDAAGEDGVEVVEVSERIDPLMLGGRGSDTEPPEEADHGNTDPHVWQDPVRMAEVVDTIATSLGVSRVCQSAAVTARAERYGASLLALDEEVAALYATIPADRRVLVTNHDAFGYLADRYDLEIVGTVIPGGSTLAEPSAADLADLVSIIEQEQVPAIFGETSDSTALIDALAAEIDRPIEVVELNSDSLGGEDSGTTTYIDLVRDNAIRISDALTD